jgi:uncharacterized protein (DUF1810 family)
VYAARDAYHRTQHRRDFRQPGQTLFAHATSDDQDFRDALRKYFAGNFDPATVVRLRSAETER